MPGIGMIILLLVVTIALGFALFVVVCTVLEHWREDRDVNDIDVTH